MVSPSGTDLNFLMINDDKPIFMYLFLIQIIFHFFYGQIIYTIYICNYGSWFSAMNSVMNFCPRILRILCLYPGLAYISSKIVIVLHLDLSSILSCVCVLVTQPCPAFCNSMDYSPPGFSVHGIL